MENVERTYQANLHDILLLSHVPDLKILQMLQCKPPSLRSYRGGVGKIWPVDQIWLGN